MPTDSGITGPPHTITGLDPETAYEVRVRAANAAGTSAWTAWEPFTTTAASGGGGGTESTPPDPDALTWEGPITISSGGTYSGRNFRSTDPLVPAVTIETTQAVIIENCAIRSPSEIVLGVDAINLTLRHTYCWGERPTTAGLWPGRIVATDGGFTNLVIENCYSKGTSGIWANAYTGNNTAGQTLRVRYNNVINVDGRHSAGATGWRTGIEDNELVQFLQFTNSGATANVEIAWNRVVNTFQQSRVEDNINFFGGSGGTSASHALIHHNLIWGAYPLDLTHRYSGGGILAGDFSGSYIDIYDNYVLGTTPGYGISIVCGENNSVYDNVVIGSNTVTEGGTRFSHVENGYVGLSGASSNGWEPGSCAAYSNNTFTNNTVGTVSHDGGRNDVYSPDATTTGTVAYANPVTYADEQAEAANWETMRSAASVVVGPNWGA